MSGLTIAGASWPWLVAAAARSSLVILLPFFVALGVHRGAGPRRRRGWPTRPARSACPAGSAAFVLGVPKFAVMMFKSLRRNLRPHVAHLPGHVRRRHRRHHDLVGPELPRQRDDRRRPKDVKVIVTEKFQIPSQMPPSYEAGLAARGDRPAGRAGRRPRRRT